MMLTEAQLDRALYVFNDVSTDEPRKSVREAIEAAVGIAETHSEKAVDLVFERHRNVLSCDRMNDPRDMARRLVSTVLEAL